MVIRTTEQWQLLFKQHEDSGTTATQFCRENDLCPKYFAKRKKDLGWNKPQLVKVKKTLRPSASSLILRYGDAQLNLSTDVSAEWVAKLVKALF